jgi:hypothetical protein
MRHYVEKVSVKQSSNATLTGAAVTISGQLCGYLPDMTIFTESQNSTITCDKPLLGDNVRITSTKPGE